MSAPDRRYPLAPLLELTRWTFAKVNRIAPCNGVEYRIRVQHGVTGLIADRLAVAAGMHPHMVWPEMAEHDAQTLTQCSADGCVERFLPRNSNARFCSPTCRHREKMRRYRSTDHGKAANRRYRKAYYWSARDYELAQMRRRRAA